MSAEQTQSAINVAAIEKELTALWKEASENESGGVVRSSILNLLIYVPNPAEASKVDDIMLEITGSHPCRAILIIADREAQESVLTAQVTSRCTLPTPNSKQVCCEQVTITASEDHLDEVPSATVPLLIADLPVYLWWRAVPQVSDKQLFGRLAEISDRMIIDSSQFNDPRGDLASMAAALRNTERWAALSDLNWAQLTAWRALIASFYDVADYRPLLDQLNKVVIRYAPPSADASAIATRALLLGGWLASRLGWRLSGEATSDAEGQTAFEMTAGDGHKITLEFAHTVRDIEPGRIAHVMITSAVDTSTVFSVRRSADGNRIETAVTRDEEKKAQRVLSYEGLGESALIARELEILGHDRIYEQAVQAAAEMISKKQ
ncbi:MAG TPA: glucose-6-phosphate dehydrogenase assembly protein OpcA [Blastocatellia bacterium]|nr:glucose-6-phosphate dehydrogenase assembly protein OpcA [Blastocatellia bacterium]